MSCNRCFFYDINLNFILNTKVEEYFFKEITFEDDGEDLFYVFPNAKEFLSIIKRREIKKVCRVEFRKKQNLKRTLLLEEIVLLEKHSYTFYIYPKMG